MPFWSFFVGLLERLCRPNRPKGGVRGGRRPLHVSVFLLCRLSLRLGVWGPTAPKNICVSGKKGQRRWPFLPETQRVLRAAALNLIAPTVISGRPGQVRGPAPTAKKPTRERPTAPATPAGERSPSEERQTELFQPVTSMWVQHSTSPSSSITNPGLSTVTGPA